MAEASAWRRGLGEDVIYWVTAKDRYVGAVSLCFATDGRLVRQKVLGRSERTRALTETA